MLIITRTVNDVIVIEVDGVKAEIMVTSIDWERGQVKLGINAPMAVKVHRKETL